MTTTNPGATSGSNPQKTLLAVAAFVIVALLGLNVYLWVNKSKQTNENQTLSTKLDETEQLRKELEKEYYQALSDLEEMRGSNAEMNALIEKKEQELTAQKNQIEKLLRNKGELDRARREITSLTAKVQEYVAEINQLRQQNEQLSSENTQLSSRNEELATTLETERQTAQSTQATLQGEKEELEKTRETLARKVNAASVIKVSNVASTPLDAKSKKSRRAKNVASVNICFSTTANEVSDPGVELFLIRILAPNGDVLAVEELGSGAFVNNANGEQLRYTRAKEANYQNDVQSICADWKPGAAFAEGLYKVEIYNKGYLAGSGSFSLN